MKLRKKTFLVLMFATAVLYICNASRLFADSDVLEKDSYRENSKEAHIYIPESRLREINDPEFTLEKVNTAKTRSSHGSHSEENRLDLERQAYVGTQNFEPLNDRAWLDNCMNLSIDIDKFGVKIVAYRIQWFSGSWSGWFVPGVNDLYKKGGEPMRRYWACFNDHNFEIIYTAPKKVNWESGK